MSLLFFWHVLLVTYILSNSLENRTKYLEIVDFI